MGIQPHHYPGLDGKFSSTNTPVYSGVLSWKEVSKNLVPVCKTLDKFGVAWKMPRISALGTMGGSLLEDFPVTRELCKRACSAMGIRQNLNNQQLSNSIDHIKALLGITGALVKIAKLWCQFSILSSVSYYVKGAKILIDCLKEWKSRHSYGPFSRKKIFLFLSSMLLSDAANFLVKLAPVLFEKNIRTYVFMLAICTFFADKYFQNLGLEKISKIVKDTNLLLRKGFWEHPMIGSGMTFSEGLTLLHLSSAILNTFTKRMSIFSSVVVLLLVDLWMT